MIISLLYSRVFRALNIRSLIHKFLTVQMVVFYYTEVQKVPLNARLS